MFAGITPLITKKMNAIMYLIPAATGSARKNTAAPATAIADAIMAAAVKKTIANKPLIRFQI